jgi:hypothetical protein
MVFYPVAPLRPEDRSIAMVFKLGFDCTVSHLDTCPKLA